MDEDRAARPDTWGMVMTQRRVLRQALRGIGVTCLLILAGCAWGLGWTAWHREPGLTVAWAALATLMALALTLAWSLIRFLWGYTWWLEGQLRRASRFPPVLLTPPGRALGWACRLRAVRRRHGKTVR